MITFFVVIGIAVVGVIKGLKDPEYRMIALALVLLLAGGTSFYHQIEGWRWLDSIYFCVVALLTVGFGDFTPKTDAGKIFTIFYLIMGVGVIGAFVNLLIKKRMERLAARSKKQGEQEAERQD